MIVLLSRSAVRIFATIRVTCVLGPSGCYGHVAAAAASHLPSQQEHSGSVQRACWRRWQGGHTKPVRVILLFGTGLGVHMRSGSASGPMNSVRASAQVIASCPNSAATIRSSAWRVCAVTGVISKQMHAF